MQKFLNFIKWILLIFALLLSAFLILSFYKGQWGFAPLEDSSSLRIDDSYGALSKYQTWSASMGQGGGDLRIKQLFIAFFGGGSLAFAGTLLQKVTRNNLSEISILGIGSINILFIFAYVFVFREKVFMNGIVGIFLPFITLVASMVGTTFVWMISRSKLANRNTFVIVGIALQLFFEALTVVFINPARLSGSDHDKKIWNIIKNYTMGQIRTSDNYNGIPWWLIFVSIILILLVLILAFLLRKKIDIYEALEKNAQSLGINIGRLKFIMFILVAILAGMEASILGTIALIGIIGPSISRLFFKNKFLPMSIGAFLIGGLLVMIASFISTNLGTNLPPGILATAIISPYFIFLIWKGK